MDSKNHPSCQCLVAPETAPTAQVVPVEPLAKNFGESRIDSVESQDWQVDSYIDIFNATDCTQQSQSLRAHHTL
eukprot:1759172-Amphidinium_carterae.1